jgi:hypothetical protein
MSCLRPLGVTIEIIGNEYNILYTLKIIDELQERTNMAMTVILDSLNDDRLKVDAVKCLLRYLTGKEIEIEIDKVDYYSRALMKIFIDQATPKQIEIKGKKKEVNEPSKIDIEHWFYMGKVVLGYTEAETWGMTLGKLITLSNEHGLYNCFIVEDKEVSIDEAIPF